MTTSRQRDAATDSDINVLRGYGVPPRLMAFARYYLGQGYSHEEAARRALAR